MTRKSHVRLIAGLVSMVVAIFIAAFDFISHLSFTSLPPLAQDVHEAIEDQSKGDDDPQEMCTNQEPCPVDETLQIQRGDTLSSVLKRALIDENQVADVLERLQSVFNPRDLRPEHELYITYLPMAENLSKRELISLHLRPSLEYEIHVRRTEEGLFKVRKEQKNLTHEMKIAKGVIENSLFIDAGQKGVPQKILHEMMQVFIHIIDFQRDFHPGDQFGVVYKTTFDPISLREKPGHLSFAILILKGKEHRIYRHVYKNGSVGYFNEKGESVKKGLLRTPIDGARISSVFGNRRHPVLGYSKMHKGVDFAAPKGTPIMASGDGVIEKIGPWGAYGNYVRIRHNKEYSTAYAHLCRFGKNLRAGVRVRQGQIIGFVGATGRTTGPHLHYELLRFNHQINPKKVTMLPAVKLGGQDLQTFMASLKHINTLYDTYVPFETNGADKNDEGAEGEEEENRLDTALNTAETLSTATSGGDA